MAGMPPCPHRPPCPGCPRYGEAGISADALADLRRLLAEAGNPPFEIVEGARSGTRHRARLMVRGRPASPKIGLFQEGSHRIVDIPECRTHHPLINRVAAALKHAIRKSGVAPYADRPHGGDLRSVQIVVERSSQRAQVVLVGNDTSSAPLAATATALDSELGDSLHSLWWNGNPERTNAILGEHWEHLGGAPAVCEEIGGVDVFFPPGAFGQSHLDLADRLVAKVASWLSQSTDVAEFYAGCGALGLGLLRGGARVQFNELNEHGLRGLELGLAARPAEERSRARVEAGPAASCLGLLANASAVIVDPPRKGLDAELLGALAAAPPPRLVYVSCDRATFARDARRLLEAGRMRLTELLVYALFPHTHHVELAARFEA